MPSRKVRLEALIKSNLHTLISRHTMNAVLNCRGGGHDRRGSWDGQP